MAEGDPSVMNNFKEQLLLKTIDCDTDDFKLALYSVALGSIDGDPVYSSTNEIVTTNYTATGESLTTLAVTQDDTNDRAKWDADDVLWSNLGSATVVEARLYDNTTALKWVLIVWEIATNPNGGNYTVAFHATNGILLVT